LRAGTSLLLLAVTSAPLAGQGVLDQFSYEGLRVSGVGFEAGVLVADRLEREATFGMRVDLGFFAPAVRPLLGFSYFRSRYTAGSIAEFETRLRGVVNDPTGDFTVDVGEVALSDLALQFDLQAIAGAGGPVSPYVGVGAGVHLRDATGAAIAGTFVEDALETLAATVNLTGGLEVALSRALRLAVDGRGMYGSGIAALTVRGVLWVRLTPAGSTP
jgi:hypothetical protein